MNRWVFELRLKVRMFSHSRMSAGREFQVDAAATEKARRASSVRIRGTITWIITFYLQITPYRLYLVSIHQTAPPHIGVADL